MPSPTPSDAGAPRLQKVLAGAGFGSRRACEELIADGRVTVDGVRAQLGLRVDPHAAEIRVDGVPVVTDERLVHLAVHKPPGMLSAMSDDPNRPSGLPTIGDLVTETEPRLFHVGRLDVDSEGLLLVTNDGPLAHRLTHPSYGVPKTYVCEVAGALRRRAQRRLHQGVELSDGPAAVDALRVLSTAGDRTLVEVVLHEGRKHIVRRLLAEVGHPVSRLIRTAIGPIRLGELPPGRTRHLGQPEVRALYAAVSL